MAKAAVNRSSESVAVSPTSDKTTMQPQKDGDTAGPEVNALSPDAALHTPSIRSGRSRKSKKSDNPQQADAIESEMKPTEQNTVSGTSELTK